MTIARSEQIDLESTPYYHCISRVVRRAFLCGSDKLTGKNFDHRKSWLIQRFKDLSSIFAIKIASYAVMSNHYHLVLYVDVLAAKLWSDSQVIEQWSRLFPNDAKKLTGFKKNELSQPNIQAIIQLWRERLSSISWFMRCLNEPLARISNKEDDCTGRFWEGRFKTQALLDEAAVLSAMAYVDLNPIRAGIATTPEKSKFTSIYERIEQLKTKKQPLDLMPFGSSTLHTKSKRKNKNKKNLKPFIDFSLGDYLQLLDISARIIKNPKKHSMPENFDRIFKRLNLTSDGWLNMVNHLENDFGWVVGHQGALALFKPNKVRKVKGAVKAKRYYAA